MDMERFTRIQSLWDSQMAWRAAKAERELQRRVVMVTGVGHVEHGWGIVSRLASFAPGASTLSILPWRGQAIDASAADLFFFCPEAPMPDSAKVSAWTKPDSTSSPRTP